MHDPKTEQHPLKPFLPKDATVLILGSFPPKKERWSMDFYYPNLQNDMWRIIGMIFYKDKEHFLIKGQKRFDKTRIEAFCIEKGIAIGDAAKSVIRINNNASDKFLEVKERIDLENILEQLPKCQSIVTTGQKATDTVLEIISAKEPKVGSYSDFTFNGKPMTLYRMPSSSRAYPKAIAEKADLYRNMFKKTGILDILML